MANDLIVVTVTYGRRWHLLRQVLASARAEGADRAVVVDNASVEDIETLVGNEFGAFAEVVSLDRNIGSAGGYRVGFQRALESGAHYVQLLDDDNQLAPGCLDLLRRGHAESARQAGVPLEDLISLAYRAEHQTSVAMGLSGQRVNARAGSFFGFHLLDVPHKIWQRLAIRPDAPIGALPERVALTMAPWSGMFFHRSVAEKHGLPNEQLLLYADDTEYSWRLIAAGGAIVLLTDARINDLDHSWNTKSRFRSAVDGYLLGEGDFRVYYGVRNQSYLEKYRQRSSLWKAVNRFAYRALLRLRARKHGRQARWKLLQRAFADGEAGRLGVSPEFPL